MKIRINLYAEEFRPRRQWATLPQMVLVWALCLLLLGASWLTVHWLLGRQQAANQQADTPTANDSQKMTPFTLGKQLAEKVLGRQA